MQVIRFHGLRGMGQGHELTPQNGRSASVEKVFTPELSSAPQLSYWAEKVNRYQQKTGFPRFDDVARCIEQDARKAMAESAQALNVKILYAGYDPSCSVWRGFPLPGSDLDHWMILLDSEDPALASAFKKSVRHKIDLDIQGHANDESPCVVLKSQVKASQNIANGRRNPVIKDFRAWDSCAHLVEIMRDGKGLIALEDPVQEPGFKDRL
ncbi:MAG: hypothetical protein K2X66_15790, partial [Cyanobacteria bacterium]|nr:hypothetical protein [Cyanobacteriota bacterium]